MAISAPSAAAKSVSTTNPVDLTISCCIISFTALLPPPLLLLLPYYIPHNYCSYYSCFYHSLLLLPPLLIITTLTGITTHAFVLSYAHPCSLSPPIYLVSLPCIPSSCILLSLYQGKQHENRRFVLISQMTREITITKEQQF